MSGMCFSNGPGCAGSFGASIDEYRGRDNYRSYEASNVSTRHRTNMSCVASETFEFFQLTMHSTLGAKLNPQITYHDVLSSSTNKAKSKWAPRAQHAAMWSRCHGRLLYSSATPADMCYENSFCETLRMRGLVMAPSTAYEAVCGVEVVQISLGGSEWDVKSFRRGYCTLVHRTATHRKTVMGWKR
jgi:hypothetical protein